MKTHQYDMTESIDQSNVEQNEYDPSKDADDESLISLITPLDLIPHRAITNTPGKPLYLLSTILASKGYLIRRVEVTDKSFVASIQVIKYEEGVRKGMQRINIPPFNSPNEGRIPFIGHHGTDLVICFQMEKDGTLKKPTWKTYIQQQIWEGAVNFFMYSLDSLIE